MGGFNMNKIFILIIMVFMFSNVSNAADSNKNYFGIDVGYAFVDLKADKTAQKLANLSGSTVTYAEDAASAYARIYYGHAINDKLDIQAGYFNTASINATYTIGSFSASESYEASGFDASFKYRPSIENGFYGKLGAHYSELTGLASITIGSTTYDIASAKASGVGIMYGIGYDFGKNEDGSGYKVGYDFYNGIGGLTGADFGLLYVGYNF